LGACLGTMLALPTVASAQSAGRIPERTASDSTPPSMEDFAAFLSAQSDKDPGSEAHLNKIVKSLKGLLARRDVNSATRFKLLRRLAEAYKQRAEVERAKALDKYRDDYRTWQITSTDDPPKLNEKAARNDQLKAVETYRQLMADYGKGDRLVEQRLDLA